jgi:hypothetical protein
VSLCDGTSDECTGEATIVRDTSDGHCPPAHFCAACSADYDQRVADGPGDPDGEEMFRDFAAENRDAAEAARKLK